MTVEIETMWSNKAALRRDKCSSFPYQSEVGRVPRHISFNFFSRGSLTGQIVAMECASGTKGAEIQKPSDLLERPRSLSPTLHAPLHSLNPSPPPLPLSLSLSIQSLFSLVSLFLSVLPYFDVLGTLAWPLSFPLSLSHTHSQTGMCGNLPLATSVTCIWSWWGAKEPTDPGDAMQIVEKPVGWDQRSSPHSQLALDAHEQRSLPHTVCTCVCVCVCVG